MLILQNAHLKVELLDPADPEDWPRLGFRYCQGGYVWQVRDARGEPFFGGPQWPAEPRPYDGQGLPECFPFYSTPRRCFPLLVERRGLVIGSGEVEPVPETKNFILKNRANWTVESMAENTGFTFKTTQCVDGYELELLRRVELTDRVLLSHTEIANIGPKVLPLHWHAHAFYSHPLAGALAELPEGYEIREPKDFNLSDQKLTMTSTEEKSNFYDIVEADPGQSFHMTARGSGPGQVRTDADFSPDYCAIWANRHSWSLEPFIETRLFPGDSKKWSLRYGFYP